jgi:hypothetical protein
MAAGALLVKSGLQAEALGLIRPKGFLVAGGASRGLLGLGIQGPVMMA